MDKLLQESIDSVANSRIKSDMSLQAALAAEVNSRGNQPEYIRPTAEEIKKKQDDFRANLKVGDKVYIECYTSMGAGSEGYRTVTAITDDAIYCGQSKYCKQTGAALSTPTMYCISELG